MNGESAKMRKCNGNL